ncbi:hypothetical protein Cs7R123_00370 [Catellatospora sp. TT07R-123]|uniref:hypothetical protein n=1 Tax=Catellatospora sp. TT07R-123 TaxID=2733863 RepID=UPI001B2553E7|nr:hypothetical protein [Catellatospora sp. TT07R-123]GHJ42695.1 hypothetical protein Cs7R123_00370 [Catellatospora sp. TT07R-123]
MTEWGTVMSEKGIHRYGSVAYALVVEVSHYLCAAVAMVHQIGRHEILHAAKSAGNRADLPERLIGAGARAAQG